MGQTKQEQTVLDRRRQEKILKLLEEEGRASSSQLSKKFYVPRGQIIQDIRALRDRGHVILAGDMVTEGGMYVVVFELPQKSSPKPHPDTPAANAE